MQTIPTCNDEISIYQGGALTEKKVIEKTGEILVAFPKIEPQMISLLRKRFKANGFNDQRMNDAIDHVIDHYTGFDKLPAIADFISYDRKIKHYSYEDLMSKYKDSYYPGATSDPINDDYIRIKVQGHSKPRFVLKDDQVKYNLELFKK